MAGSVNKVILVGNLGRDPEVRFMQSGEKVVNLNLATSESWRDKASGERREKTEWHRVVIFNPNLAEIAEKYLRKGSKVYVEGQLQTRKWQDKEGAERFTTEIALSRFRGELTLLDGRGDSMGAGEAGSAYSAGPSMGDEPGSGGGRSQPGRGPAGGGRSMKEDLDDDIPF